MNEDPSELQAVRDEIAALRADLRAQHDQLARASKLASLGELVHGIAHEITTPLGAIASMKDTLAAAVEKLKSSLAPDQSRETQAALRAIESAIPVIALGSSRTLEIVKRIRKLAREDDQRRPVDLHAELEDALLLVQHEIRSRIQVQRSFGAVPPIVCNAGQIGQVFLNLLLNAVQAIADRGTIEISTVADQGHVSVQIHDDGVGIPAADLPRVFEPGFTTKQAGEGSGIGLSICRRIVEEHGGRIDVHSEPGKGTTVTVRLPILEPPARDAAG